MKYIYVANWKMNFTFHQSIEFCNQNFDTLQQFATHNTFILCPSFISIQSLTVLFKNSTIAIGAQNCSEFTAGAYTGEISARSLKEIGVSYCIIGHSERRQLFYETNTIITQKIDVLLDNNIIPIICIGETHEDFKNNNSFLILTQQLNPIIETLKTYPNKTIVIAYEPVWSIGTGIIPEISYLETIFSWISKTFMQQLSHTHVKLLYGGSINADNASELKKLSIINGFLIGKVSTNIEQLQKIIIQ